ncbi:MAG TPA: hypothetical protein VFI13_11750, partial [Gemmatimonadales bacterium]|nr:hypothetical protein [Gemmatimonadales bacterium]
MPKSSLRPAHFSLAFKVIVGAISLLGGIATIYGSARQEGVIGPLTQLRSNVAFIRVTPATDTAFAIGDTLHFAALATDTNGVQLGAPALTWTLTNTEVAEAHPDG